MEVKKRDRVAKACEYCRKKKIKCNGQTPCSNCKGECIYLINERKPRKRVTKPKSETVQALDDRLGRLEKLLLSLTAKLGGSVEQITPDDEESSDDTDDDSTTNEDQDYEQALSGGNAYMITESKVAGEYNEEKKVFHLSEKFYGSHSNFRIFSDKSFRWMQNQLPPEDTHLLIPVNNMPIVLALCMKTFNDIWFNSRPVDEDLRRRLSEGWFPEDETLIFDLIQCIDKIFLASYVANSKDLEILFRAYYHNVELKNRNMKDSDEYKVFTDSELLIMNISLSLCIASVIDKRMACEGNEKSHNENVHTHDNSQCNPGKTPSLFTYSLDDLIQLQTKFFSSSIYYYGMVSLLSDGVETIQGILLMILFLETSWIKLSVSYILASIAVRYGQEIGLHRMETFQGLTEEESSLRRRLWYFCEYLDMEVCYRHGKPPLINPNDVSTLSGKDLLNSMKNHLIGDNSEFPKKFQGNFDPLDPDFLQFVLQHKDFNSYMGFVMHNLTKIKSKSYSALFSASSSNHSLEDLISTLKILNEDMDKLKQSMDKDLRPKFYYEHDFDQCTIFNQCPHSSELQFSLCFHLTYFVHLMTINRLITQVDVKASNNKEILNFRHLYLNSARTILHIVKKIDRKNVPHSCINWLIFYPCSAFLSLLSSCLNTPDLSETFNDMNLLMDVTTGFFAFNKSVYFKSKPGVPKVYSQRDSTIFLICGVILAIGIKIIESKSHFKFSVNNPRFVEHVKDCRRLFPEMYKPTITTMALGKPLPFKYSDWDDSPLRLPSSLLPGPTGYLTIPFHSPSDKSPNSDFKSKTSSNETTGSTPYEDKNSLSTLLFQSPGNNKIGLTEAEFNENLDKFFGNEINSPNFFFDNNLGL